MDLKRHVIMILVAVVTFLFVSKENYGLPVAGIRKEENLELEKQLEILNKPLIKTIRTQSGDIFDCIDIDKQPAFDHPLLRNHKIQMKPDFTPQQTINFSASSNVKLAKTELELHNERCPSGTVPIRKTKKDELLNAKYLTEKIRSSYNFNGQLLHTHFVSLQPNENAIYHGARAFINVYNPLVKLDQFSTAQIWIQNGPAKEINSIEFGWAVYFKLFGDNMTRLFGYWTADGYENTGCFNMLCSGFVQIHSTITLGASLTPVSVYKGQQYMMDATVYLNPISGHWWLFVGGESGPAPIGYWPKELFTHLAKSASVIRYGGIASADPGPIPTPQMGNGHLPTHDIFHACHMRNMKVVNETGSLVNFHASKVQIKQDTLLECYNLAFNGYVDKNLELAMSFGGPGGMCP